MNSSDDERDPRGEAAETRSEQGAPEPQAAAAAARQPAWHSWRRRLARELAYIVILGTPVLLFFLIAQPRSQAGRLLKELNAIEVSRTHFRQVERLATQYGGNAACVADNCLFQFQNAWMNRLHLAPLTEFSVMIERSGSPSDAGGGGIRAIDMAMLVSRRDPGDWPGSGTIASALVFDRGGFSGERPFQASITFGVNGVPGRTVVRIAPKATPSQRARARAFNLRCLTRIGGCNSSRELLPGIWSGAERIQEALAAPGRPAPPVSTASHY
ncbi:MAG: hypothetical protein ACRD01_15595 [Terriglobales bacterium]